MKNIINTDTIIAPITSIVGGSVTIIRISGPECIDRANQLFFPQDLVECKSGTIHHGYIKHCNKIVDEVMLSIFRKPKSYTGEDVIEISSHANPFIVKNIIDLFIQDGCRYAEPGEFTRRAFLNEKIDLTQAEAVQEIISAQSKTAVDNAIRQLEGSLSGKIKTIKSRLIKIASLIELDLDFTDDDVDIIKADQIKKEINITIDEIKNYTESYKIGKNFSMPTEVVITGKPNVGKSSLMNALLKKERVIVSDVPGTTRDYIHEEIMINDVIVKFIDTAGIHITENEIEKKGVQKTKQLFSNAQQILILMDISEKPEKEDKKIIEQISNKYADKILIVGNKKDLGKDEKTSLFLSETTYEKIIISAHDQEDVNILKEKIFKKIQESVKFDKQEIYITSERQYQKLIKSNESLKNVTCAIDQEIGNEFLSVDMREALNQLSEIIGEITNDDILNNIFNNFCIGK